MADASQQIARMALDSSSIVESSGLEAPKMPEDLLKRFPSMLKYQEELTEYFDRMESYFTSQLIAIKQEDD
tara:strand:+ start:116 stop:328 length:213 start_codon:yes stop_codon:yes gene_type:complete